GADRHAHRALRGADGARPLARARRRPGAGAHLESARVSRAAGAAAEELRGSDQTARRAVSCAPGAPHPSIIVVVIVSMPAARAGADVARRRVDVAAHIPRLLRVGTD